MALQDPQAEPSMEEILASIRRIISEEEQAPAPEPVLDLTQSEAPAPAPMAAAAPPPMASDDDIVFDEEPSPEPAYEAPVAAAPVYTPPPSIDLSGVDTILSQPSASAAAGSMARLAGSLRISDAPNQTIEGVVRELLKPMLKDWLDKNLPAIVESRVEAELERIARLAR
jgi:hypothetical protein